MVNVQGCEEEYVPLRRYDGTSGICFDYGRDRITRTCCTRVHAFAGVLSAYLWRSEGPPGRGEKSIPSRA